MRFGWTIAAMLGAAVPAGLLLHRRRKEAVARAWARDLEGDGMGEPFEPGMVEAVPEPGRRFLLRSIAPGTPLADSVRLIMDGSIRLSRDGDPLSMRSREVLAPPRGLVWRARVGSWPLSMRGYDLYVDGLRRDAVPPRSGGPGEMRWWVWGLLPVVRSSGPDFRRSAVGRLLGEAVFVPSVLLPDRGGRWERVDATTARVKLRAGGEEVPLTLDIAPDGALQRVSLPRWNGDPRNGPVGYLPFVCDRMGEEGTFGGYTIPTRFRAGWSLGTPGAFPFFEARIREARYR